MLVNKEKWVGIILLKTFFKITTETTEKCDYNNREHQYNKQNLKNE